jgi:GT2 family glycosyltransferase
MEGTRISVIIPSWNACDLLGACLDSVERQNVNGRFETIVVDNASTDGTAELLRRHTGRVRVISNAVNVGFSAANNQAAAEADGDVLLFLNSDVELLSDGVLEHLATLVEGDDGVGLAGPLLVNPDGSPQPSCAAHPSVHRALIVGSGLHRLLPNAARRRITPEFWSHDEPIDTGWVMGAALAIRADVFRRLRGFWPTMYAEDEDLAFRAQELGLRVRFDNAAKVMHVGNHSNTQRWSSPTRAARVAAAELSFLYAHYPRPRATAIRLITGAAYGARAITHTALRRAQPASVYRAMARVYARGSRARGSQAC